MDFPLLSQRFLFSVIDTSPLDKESPRGRPPFPRPVLLRTLVYKNIRCLSSLTELAIELREHPNISATCGLVPSSPLPSIERLPTLLHDTPDPLLQNVRIDLVKQLASTGEITFKYISTDSCPVQANIKENNVKTIARNRFDKSKIPEGDPDCRSGTIVTYPSPHQRKIEYFWGCRNHII